MLWMLCSLFFFWLVFREVRSPWRADRPQPIYFPYLMIVSLLALAFAWPPFSKWRLEQFLEEKGLPLSDQKPFSVHCNTAIDTMFDPNVFAVGHANPRTGEIVFQTPWCDVLRSYLRDPENVDDKEIMSLHIFTHEVMHIRGELNEAVTECQAVQRNARTARLLGVPDALALEHGRRYYEVQYAQRAKNAGFSSHYYSRECAPGKLLDEKLPDSVWVNE